IPADNILTSSSMGNLPKKILMRDILGRIVSEIFPSGRTEISADIRALPGGIYFIDLGKSHPERIVVKHLSVNSSSLFRWLLCFPAFALPSIGKEFFRFLRSAALPVFII